MLTPNSSKVRGVAGAARLRKARCGSVRQVRLGFERRGAVRFSKAGQDWVGGVRSVPVGLGRSGSVW
jgi:hypothetical protein